MSNYEGKTYYRRRGTVDLIDLLYYEAFGEILSREDKKKLQDSIENNKERLLSDDIIDKQNTNGGTP